MKAAHRRTLLVSFSTPTATNLAWRQIEALFVALGAQVIEGRGSRVRFELNGVLAPQKTYSGKVLLRIDPALHARAAALAEAEGKSLNAWTQEQIQKAVTLA
ncbi:MAG TPA: toxin-antitoxin system HicB family antitoxin [Caldilineaceae bacterium]|nr:toxin-antitoxin system HicB family antitoxin [Caldilineaceae bacterium]